MNQQRRREKSSGSPREFQKLAHALSSPNCTHWGECVDPKLLDRQLNGQLANDIERMTGGVGEMVSRCKGTPSSARLVGCQKALTPSGFVPQKSMDVPACASDLEVQSHLSRAPASPNPVPFHTTSYAAMNGVTKSNSNSCFPLVK